MKKLMVMLLFILFVISKACFAGEDKMFKETISDSGVILRTEIDKNSYKFSEQIKLSVKLVNSSKEDISIGVTNGLIGAKITVLNAKTKEAVPLTSYGKKLYDPNRPIFMNKMETINPSQSYVFNMILNKIFDLSLASDYEVEVEVYYFDLSKKELCIKSQPLKFNTIE